MKEKASQPPKRQPFCSARSTVGVLSLLTEPVRH